MSSTRKLTERRRIGFMLASMHTGSGNVVWPAMARLAESRGVDLFLFPGGRLGARDGHEHLRNRLFRLIQPGSVDGLVSWASAIGGSTSPAALRRLHARLAGIPTVTMNEKIADWPVSTLDAYGGMRSLFNHLLDVHGYRRIAYLRGPASHASANERFRAARDAVRERGFALDPRLITSPWPWGSGRQAMEELLDDRKLVPGRDFEVVVGASDLLLFDALRLLQSRGFRIPVDCAAAGFNDSAESRMLSPTFTTVHMHFEKQGLIALGTLLDLIDGKPIPPATSLPSRLVVRQSCGCLSSSLRLLRADHSRAARTTLPGESRPDTSDLLDAALEQNRWGEESRRLIERLASAFGESVGRHAYDPFLAELQRALDDASSEGGELDPWQDVITLLRVHHYGGWSESLEPFVEDLLSQGRLLISETCRRAETFARWKEGQVSRVLSELEKDLLANTDRFRIGEILAAHLPSLEIRSCHIVALGSAHHRFAERRLVTGFAACEGEIPGVALSRELCDRSFAANQILPWELLPDFPPSAYAVGPIIVDEEMIGYLVTGIGMPSGYIYEEIRSILSSALKGIGSFEAVNRARAAAEAAELEKTRFLANVSGNLRLPLEQTLTLSRELAGTIRAAHAASAEFAGSLVDRISELAEFQLQSVDDLMALALTQAEDLALNREIVEPAEVIREVAAEFSRTRGPTGTLTEIPPRLPLLLLDREQFSKALALLLASHETDPPLRLSAHFAPPFVEIRIAGAPARRERRVSAALARQLVLLHGGTVRELRPPRGEEHGASFRHSNGARRPFIEGQTAAVTRVLLVLLPLPTLAGPASVCQHNASAGAVVLSSNDEVPQEIRAEPWASATPPEPIDPALLFDRSWKGIGERTLAWDMEGAPFADRLFVPALRNNATVQRTPFAVYSRSGALCRVESLRRFFEIASRSRGSGPVVIIDPDRGRRLHFAAGLEAVRPIPELIGVESADELATVLCDASPVVFLVNLLAPHVVLGLRSMPKLAQIPILMFVECLASWEDIAWCADVAAIAVYNSGVLTPAELRARIDELRLGRSLLPPHTAVAVKRALLYFNTHAARPISRWQAAEAAGVSEDYLTKVFHRELGLSPWEYLNRYRIRLAGKILRGSQKSVRAVAFETGFQDDAYFCRVFRAVMGLTPSEFRVRGEAATTISE